MPDISMCPGHNCPKKEECYRFIAIPSEYWQAYFVSPPFCDEKECEFLLPVEEP